MMKKQSLRLVLVVAGFTFASVSAFVCVECVAKANTKSYTDVRHRPTRMVLADPEKVNISKNYSPSVETLKGMTLSRFMVENSKLNSNKYADFESLMICIQTAFKQISNLVSRAGLDNLTGLEGDINVQGEEQKKLDVISNDILKQTLKYTGKMGVVSSEEEDKPILIEESPEGKYVATFDPLDGSSNIDAGISTGTIFGIFKETLDQQCLFDDSDDLTAAELDCLMQTLQPGSDLVAAGYCMYSSSTILVVTFGDGVHGFTLDNEIGEFVLTHPDMKIPRRGRIYSFNEANSLDWDECIQQYVSSLKRGDNQSETKYSSRYIGSMVGDVHRTLLYGGIFGYPSDTKNPNGKLRLLYEAAPISFIVEQAGGISTTGSQRIMDITPESVHQRIPVFLGSPADVNELKSYYNK
mmetsp:Transcript_3348/g.4381  ORF Transcript_3348/g.4381 Transcript_3348/m.4381 type:complete len:411 (+) Transcript_3348:102-1334(+)